jgi:hypothetical protein
MTIKRFAFPAQLQGGTPSSMKREIFLVLLWLGIPAATCCGQGPGSLPGRYQPSRPTVSPYLNLLRRDAGPIPNYFSLVRPQLQQLETNQRQQAINLRQQDQLQNLDNQMLTITQSPAAATGTGATFRNYGGYYSTGRAGGAPGTGVRTAGAAPPSLSASAGTLRAVARSQAAAARSLGRQRGR